MNTKIRQLISSYGGLSTDIGGLSDDADLYRVGLKSHACVELMLALEDSFQVEFSDEMLTRATFRSIGAIERAVAVLRGAEFAA
jgi:acyl carrier protein